MSSTDANCMMHHMNDANCVMHPTNELYGCKLRDALTGENWNFKSEKDRLAIENQFNAIAEKFILKVSRKPRNL